MTVTQPSILTDSPVEFTLDPAYDTTVWAHYFPGGVVRVWTDPNGNVKGYAVRGIGRAWAVATDSLFLTRNTDLQHLIDQVN